MRSIALFGYSSVSIGLLVGSLAVGHENDPKAFEKRTPNLGPSWRLDVEGANGIAGTGGGEGIQLAANITMGEIDSGEDGNDIWGYTSASGREYALMGTTSGTSFIEVTNPGNPQIVGYIDGPNSLWRDVKTYGPFAYIVSEGGSGIQVISLSGIDNGNISLASTITTGGGTATHNVAIDPVRGMLARCGGGSSGIRLYDLLINPTNPPFVGEWSDEYVHDAQLHTMTTGPYAGRTIAFCCGGLNGGSTNTGLDIIDVTSPSNPVRLGGVQYPGGSYCHQGWLSADEQYFYINDELYSGTSSTFIVRVSDLQNPAFVTRWTNNNSAICHNLYVAGDLIYCANYQSGLRVLDKSNPQALTEVAFYDTYPSGDNQSFNGLWSVYPYFDSGTVIGSDIESGLFVWSTDLSYIGFNVTELPDPISSSGAMVSVEMLPNDTTIDASTAVAVFNDGTGSQQISLSPIDGTNFTGTLPALECPGQLSIRFAVFDTDGELYESSNSTTSIYDGQEVVFYDDAQTNAGYSVSGNALDGSWDRGVPVQCNRGDPGSDGDGSGSCWLTDNSSAASCNSDVDDGSTTLTSPALDATATGANLSYWCWYDNTGSGTGADPGNDVFVVEISGDNGSSWTGLEIVGPSDARSSGGWNRVSFLVSDYVTPSTSVRVRFTAADENAGSVIEAGIDGLSIDVVSCDDASILADINNDGLVDGQDLSIVLGFWGACEDPGNCPADLTLDGIVDGQDLSIVLGFWGSL
ncbi:MAG: choice-of-anchor B family protein [Phycisphaerales bacterium]|nr:choice-of-anchor B family protein [Phycisphaerales bacterium]